MEIKQLREQGYTLLSQLFEQPSDNLVDTIKSTPYKEYWQRIEEIYGISIPHSWQAENLPQLSQLLQMWAVTMGPVKPLAEPIESLYKQWTIDPSCEMTFARQKGWLRGDWACHMEEILKDLGFEVPQQFNHCPDHIILIFELMGAMVENAPYEVQHQFASQHLDWLDDLIETAIERKAPTEYVELYKLCKDFVEADKLYLAKQQNKIQ
ncbi:TorD/DmsD family molecular chaperone [Desulfuribacillus alkaliarsenatis]|uniref:Uncharacterized protein n=1 Tax=Desulfuribacillus alkaliarsenatis TaxID=766136 RepID=A0A1E5G3L2_9FIRM|nr:molecular chaperone TorD family protein [Desulfuribacillus alkaliarsenatis]OEF97678.1 hypothetical protein BHF68_14345 [Desulfuribacillus alkaliarsenatis]